MRVSIIIPVLNKVEFSRQCLDRIVRNSGDRIAYEVIIVDNGSSDGTAAWGERVARDSATVRYHRNDRNFGFAAANNIGARLARGDNLLFLNNDTLVQPGWLSEMVRVREADPAVGIVGIKQLFPYTNVIYHIGVVFAPGGIPQHLYPHLDASLPFVNKEREYQAVTGACLLIDRSLFHDCGGFDEGYRNGYEDTDLCLAVRQRGRKVVCCTSAFIYHYGQISEGRTADDDQNAARFAEKWGSQIRVDQDDYLARDRADTARPAVATVRQLAADCIYLADDLSQGSAQTWVNAELALAAHDRGVPILVNGATLSPTLADADRRRLKPLMLAAPPVGGVQIKWSHYWPRHLNLELAGDVNLEFFVINYRFGQTQGAPWDYWLQCLRQNHRDKLPVSDFCKSVLQQVGVPETDCHVLHHGYSRDIREVEPPARGDGIFRFLTVTNSHDLERYNTQAVLDAYATAFATHEDVALVIKDYGASSGVTTLRESLAQRPRGGRIDFVSDFTGKPELIRLYKSCDAFVSAHRGEGFGMKILDAMACGLPVITPLFGGPTAYCEPNNCYPVAFNQVALGDCLDMRSLHITNQPMWAEVDVASLAQQMRAVYENRIAASRVGQAGRDLVLERFSWDSIAGRLIEIAADARARHGGPVRRHQPAAAPVERSPYWLGLRVSVIIPTHNRKETLRRCLLALAEQSVLPQEFEVVVVDDGSTDGTQEAIAACEVPFTLRYVRQDQAGPGAARNLGVEHAAGELILFLGDDIIADRHLLEQHLLAHAVRTDSGAAVLGHIDWPPTMQPNAVMDYVCGEGMLQFAYTYIPTLEVLDHRFFYTSNISLKRQFLVDAADAGIRFDSCFRRAAFEDSEFAFRLGPRGLRITYAPEARATHDHWMDFNSFAKREFGAGEMAVIFYRKHPGQDDHLQVRWIADMVEPALALLGDQALLRRLEQFDRQTDALLQALAGSLEELIAMHRESESPPAGLSVERSTAALHNVFHVAFDVERTRGKLQEWYSNVADPAPLRAAQTLATVRRKMEFFSQSAAVPVPLASSMSGLTDRLATLGAQPTRGPAPPTAASRRRGMRMMIARPAVLSRLLRADRFIETRLQSAARSNWLARYRRLRSRVRRLILSI